jgi:hypothetical protein
VWRALRCGARLLVAGVALPLMVGRGYEGVKPRE